MASHDALGERGGGRVEGTVGGVEHVGVEGGATSDDGQVGVEPRELDGLVDVRSVDPARDAVGVGHVARPVDLLAPRVDGDEVLGAEARVEGERVERADAVAREAEGRGEGARGDDPDPQPGERSGTHPDGDVGEVGGATSGVGERVAYRRGEQLAVRHRPLALRRPDDLVTVVHGDAHRGSGRVDREQQHTSEPTLTSRRATWGRGGDSPLRGSRSTRPAAA